MESEKASYMECRYSYQFVVFPHEKCLKLAKYMQTDYQKFDAI
jgi:hypothetical protein